MAGAGELVTTTGGETMAERREREEKREAQAREGRSAGESAEREGAARNADEDEVRRRAYDRYLARGEGGGDDVSDWLEAERDVHGDRDDERS